MTVGSNYVIRPEWGHFIGRVVTEWLPDCQDGRKVQLLEDFAFVDKRGEVFEIPAGTVVDGKSIPPILWGSILGSPFTGVSRIASVPHDYECVKRVRPWKQVHRMFYEACMCAGTDETLAAQMRRAVWHHGPRWDKDGKEIDYDENLDDVDDGVAVDWSGA